MGAELSQEQAAAVKAIRTAIEQRDPTPLLLEGVTGGGKTAIYVEAIVASLEAGRPALVLVPEIALATPLVDRLRADLDARVALVHSGLAKGSGPTSGAGSGPAARTSSSAHDSPSSHRSRTSGSWSSTRSTTPPTRATGRPVSRPATRRSGSGELAGAAVILGSGDAGSRERGPRPFRSLPTPRPARATRRGQPAVEVVDLREELRAGNRGLISERLARALGELDTERGDRAILVLNRRGSASVVLCRDCGHVQECPECQRPLVYHHAGITLRCHHCGRATPLATRCPACKSPRIRYLGGGTERVERDVRERFPIAADRPARP